MGEEREDFITEAGVAPILPTVGQIISDMEYGIRLVTIEGDVYGGPMNEAEGV